MKYSYKIFLILTIIMIVVYFFQNESTIKEINRLPTAEYKIIKTVNSTGSESDAAAKNMECRAKSTIKFEIDKQLKIRDENMVSLAKKIQENRLPKNAESFIFQSVGITHAKYLKYKSGTKPKINSLQVTDEKPFLLKKEDDKNMVDAIDYMSIQELSDYIKSRNIPHSTIIGGKSVLSYIIGKRDLNDKVVMSNFIINSGVMVNFYDLISSIDSKYSFDVIRELANNYKGDLNRFWISDYTQNNLSTISALHGRPELVEFWSERGVPAIVSINGVTVNTILDMFSSFHSDVLKAKYILNIARKAEVIPVGYHAYLFFSEIADKNDPLLQNYLTEIQVSFTSKYNFTKLPQPINLIIESINLAKAELNILSAELNKCYSNKIENPTDTKSAENTTNTVATAMNLRLELSQHKISTSEKINNDISDLIYFLDDAEHLLKDGKFPDYVELISSQSKKVNSQFSSGFLSLALVRLIQHDSPAESIVAIAKSGALVSPESIVLLSIRNNSKSIIELSKLTNGIKLNESHKDQIKELHKRGKINKKTIESLTLSNYL